MENSFKFNFLAFLFCFLSMGSQAQDIVVVDSILIKGNTISKEKIIYRLLDVKRGDTLVMSDLNEILDKNAKLLMNSGMFHEVQHNVVDWKGEHVKLVFTVRENRLFIPVPGIDLADRNFNVWWKEYNFSLKRINFEMGVHHSNLTGYNDQVKVFTQLGYTRKIEVIYTRPYLFKAKNWGYSTGIFYAINKEVNYNTTENKINFYRDDDDFMLKRFRLHGALLYSHKTKHRHRGDLTYFKNRVDQKVLDEYNDQFFNIGDKEQNYFQFKYAYSYSTRDINYYPKKGKWLRLEIIKDGLGLFNERNFTRVSADYTQFFSFSDRISSAHKFKISRELNPHYEDYFNYRSLGYEDDELRGYEISVINGLHYYYSQQTLRYKIFDTVYDWKQFMPIKAFKLMPIEVDFIIFGDVGYVEDPYKSDSNTFTNQFLFGKGAGLDILLFNRYLFQVQYSINHVNQHGLYLHYKYNIE